MITFQNEPSERLRAASEVINVLNKDSNLTAEAIGKSGDEITAIRNHYGNGEVVWIPSMIGLGARRGSSEPLSGFLRQELENSSSGRNINNKVGSGSRSVILLSNEKDFSLRQTFAGSVLASLLCLPYTSVIPSASEGSHRFTALLFRSEPL
ncbi:MAG TPA: hypothetical protein PKX27_01850 [Bacteroidales bacterium]|jgi:hypothetical protein|nr:hypothetical protein [Bacteroidales bacterium]HPM86699.1 hypothetical protein [Bacteroidales bacterium]HQM68356.1 hypothetical protein [Bacteroidales bacterium]